MNIKDALAACGDFDPATLSVLDFTRQELPIYPVLREGWPTQLLNQAEMHKLGLGVWHSSRGWWLLGSKDESLHTHERWLYMSDDRVESWYQINPHRDLHWSVENLDRMLKSELDDLHYNQLVRGRGRREWSASVHWRATNHKPNTLEALEHVLLDGRLSPVELHELIYHFETWAQHHPEAADLPRELVWRMHGLGEAAGLAHMNRAARMQGLWDDDAFMLAGEPVPSWERRA